MMQACGSLRRLQNGMAAKVQEALQAKARPIKKGSEQVTGAPPSTLLGALGPIFFALAGV